MGFFVAGLILSYVSVEGMRYLAERHKILDIPNERSSHSRSVPRGGGLPIVVVTLLGVWFYVWFHPLVERWPVLAYTVGALSIATVSWLDDLRSQPNWLRFAIHSLGAVLALYGFGYLPTGGAPLEWLGFMISFFWIVGLTNAYNFMDGIDGIAGVQAVIGGLAWAALGLLSAQPLIVAFGIFLAASSLGFLIHNWSPARIFMGDVGSAFLGYSLAVLPFIYSAKADHRGHWLGAIALGILPVWPFVFDASFTFLRRWRMGEDVFSAHRSHLYQRLVIVGHTHRFVSLFYGGTAVLGAVLLLSWKMQPATIRLTVPILLPLLCLSLWAFVTRIEQNEARRPRSRQNGVY